MTYHWSRWCHLGSGLLYDLINPSDGALMISIYSLINTNGFLWYRVISRFIWRRHQMKTFSAWLDICAGNSPVTGEFPSQRPVTQSFDILFDLHLNKRLNKQWWGWWFEIPSGPIWRYCNASYWLDRKMEFLSFTRKKFNYHYNDVIMSAIASQITSLTIVCSTVFFNSVSCGTVFNNTLFYHDVQGSWNKLWRWLEAPFTEKIWIIAPL